HAAWRRLLLAPGSDEADLSRIRQVVEANVPDQEQRDALLAWAGERRTHRHVRTGEQPDYHLAAVVPDLEWFRYWVLYDDWSVKPSMFEAKKEALVKQFDPPECLGRKVSEAVLSWGADLSRRRKDLRPLPDGERKA